MQSQMQMNRIESDGIESNQRKKVRNIVSKQYLLSQEKVMCFQRLKNKKMMNE